MSEIFGSLALCKLPWKCDVRCQPESILIVGLTNFRIILSWLLPNAVGPLCTGNLDDTILQNLKQYPLTLTCKFIQLTALDINTSCTSTNHMMPFVSFVYTLVQMVITPKSYKYYETDRANTLNFSCTHH